jgi:non-heme chloroperoxidase
MEAMSLIEQFGTSRLSAVVMVDGTLFRPNDASATEQLQKQVRAMLVDRKKYVAEQVPGMFRRQHANDLYDRIGGANLKTPTPIAITLQADSLGRDSRQALKHLNRPALFIDRSGAGADALAAIVSKEVPSARTEVMSDVGHALFLDDPERFNEILESFVRGLVQKVR